MHTFFLRCRPVLAGCLLFLLLFCGGCGDPESSTASADAPRKTITGTTELQPLETIAPLTTAPETTTTATDSTTAPAAMFPPNSTGTIRKPKPLFTSHTTHARRAPKPARTTTTVKT